MRLCPLSSAHISLIVNAFAAHSWPKPASTFEQYFEEQTSGTRVVWLAFSENKFAGYVTLTWQSAYAPFVEAGIPEIMDLNVLPPFRQKGIGTALLDAVEEAAFQKSDTVGLGVGLYADYGAAQKLYVKRGYVPDGRGVTYDSVPVKPGSTVCLDDALVLRMTKKR